MRSRTTEDADVNTRLKAVDFVGKPYTPELGRQMPYGAVITTKGIIKRVMTKEDYPELDYERR